MIHHVFFFLCFFSTLFLTGMQKSSSTEDRLSRIGQTKSSPNIIGMDSSSASTGEEQKRKLQRKRRYLTTSSPRGSSDGSSDERSSEKSPNRSPKMLLRRSFQKSADHSSDQDSYAEQHYNREKKQKNTPLIKAVLENNPTQVKKILESDINLNQCNHHHYNALHYACMTDAYEIVELLLDDDRIDPSVHDHQGLMACHLFKQHNEIKIKLLRKTVQCCEKFRNKNYFDFEKLKKENDINITDEEGISPLIWATCSNQKKIVKKLLNDPNNPVDINHTDKFCGTALHYASLLGLSNIFNALLLNYRTDTLIKNSFEQTPIQCVIKGESKMYRAMHHALFTRSQLIEVVPQETFAVLMEQRVQKFPSDDDQKNDSLITTIIQYIHAQIESLKEHQSADMPEAGVPPYATNEFLKQLIYFQYESLKTTNTKKESK